MLEVERTLGVPENQLQKLIDALLTLIAGFLGF